ncbi:MAG: J domain-containing protein [Deltaproteobacteria bacterium]|jgi:DnaJ-class molecular chaperone|nr:J domain-containing protein [Deltaproteobacteria bacterium]
MIDPYKTLGVPKTAGSEEIKKVYRQLARRYHPDLNPGDPAAEAKFKELSEAYDILSDPDKKREYDTLGRDKFYREGFGGAGYQRPNFESRDFSWADLFNDILGGGSRSSRQNSSAGSSSGSSSAGTGGFDFSRAFSFGRKGDKGLNREHAVTLDFQSGLKGREITLELDGKKTCSRCSGHGVISSGGGAAACPQCRGAGTVKEHQTLKVLIPAGVKDGQIIRLKGRGWPGDGGGEPGDLLLKVSLAPDETFTRQDQDLFADQAVSLYDCLLGGTVEVPTLSGRASLKLPAGTQNGQTFRLKGQGVPEGAVKKTGDLYVTVKVTLPGKLSAEARALVQTLRQAAPVNLQAGTAETA